MQSDNLEYLSNRILAGCRFRMESPGNARRHLSNDYVSLIPVLAEIFKDWHQTGMTETQFSSQLDKFNTARNTKLTVSDFERLCWIRYINGRLVLPQEVLSAVFRNSRKEFEEETGQPGLYLDFLESVLDDFNYDHAVVVERSYLRERIDRFMPGQEDMIIEALIAADYMELNPAEDRYSFRFAHSKMHVADELAARLWYVSVRVKPDIFEFRRYLQRLHDLQVWPRQLGGYLNDSDKRIFANMLREMLLDESDLAKSDREFVKVAFDNRMGRHLDPDKISLVSFEERDPFLLVRQAEQMDTTGKNLFIIQETRALYALGLSMLLQTDYHAGGYYTTVLSLLRVTDRPYIVLKLYELIRLNYPHLIPYLLQDLNTIPLAFLALEDVDQRIDLLPKRFNSEQKEETTWRWRKALRNDFIREALECFRLNMAEKSQIADCCYYVLDILLREAVSFYPDTDNGTRGHLYYLNEYRSCFQRMAENRINSAGRACWFPFEPDIFGNWIARMSEKIGYKASEHLQLGSLRIHHGVELLKVIMDRKTDKFYGPEDALLFKGQEDEILSYIFDEFKDYFTLEQVEIVREPGEAPQSRGVSRGLRNSVVDVIDWPFLLMRLESEGQLRTIEGFVESSILVLNDPSVKRHHRAVQELSEKLKSYLQVCMLAFVGASDRLDHYKLKQLAVDRLLNSLAYTIRKFALQYSVDDLASKKLDIFDDRLHLRANFLYTDNLLSLLYQCVNYLHEGLGKSFIIELFRKSSDLDRMLKALNSLNSKDIKDALIEKIEGIDVDSFARRETYNHQLLNTLIDAVNSDQFWQKIGRPLIARFLRRLRSKSINYGNTPFVVFELQLLVAFKARKSKQLPKVQFLGTNPVSREQQQYLDNKKAFYLAAFKLYHEKAYDEAIAMFEALIADEPKNIEYHVRWFIARTFKAVDTKDGHLLATAYMQWDEWVDKQPEDERKLTDKYTNMVLATKLYYLARSKDYEAIETILRKLPDRYKYDDELIEPITGSFTERGIMGAALSYLIAAIEFNNDIGTPVSSKILGLLETISGEQDLKELSSMLNNLSSLPAVSIPKIVPGSINDGKTIEGYILRELIFGCKLVVEKTGGLGKLTKENLLTDLLVSIFHARLPLWGWSIHDQSRTGTGKGRVDAGSADILIKRSGDTIALVEALKIENDPIGHVIKTRKNYSQALRYYFILTYVTKPGADMDAIWGRYIQKIGKIDFGKEWNIGKLGESTVAVEDVDCPDNMRLGKTLVGDTVVLYHIAVKTSVE